MILILAICETCRNTQEIHHLDFSKVSCRSCGDDIENDVVDVKNIEEPTTLQKLSMMKKNVRDLQESLTNANKRIKYLNDLVKL